MWDIMPLSDGATIQSDDTVKCQRSPRYADDKHMVNRRSTSQSAKTIRTYVLDFINCSTKSENEIKKKNLHNIKNKDLL